MLSVVITTHNRHKLLREALKNLVNQSLSPKKYEIIIGDSYSENNGLENKQVVEHFISLYPQHHLSYFYENSRGGCTLTKNNAVKRALGKYILFSDDDAVLDRDALKACMDVLGGGDVAIVTGSLIPKFEEAPSDYILSLWCKNKYGRFIQDFTVCDFGNTSQDISFDFVWASNFGCKKSIFVECGGFAPDGFAGDLVLYNGMGETWFAKNVADQGYRIVYVPGMTAKHFVAAYRFKDEYFKARHYYYGITASFDAIRKHGNVDSILLLVVKQIKSWFGCAKQLLTNHDRMAVLKKRAFFQGYYDHQQAVRHNPELLDYVCRENWLDFDFSSLKPLKMESR